MTVSFSRILLVAASGPILDGIDRAIITGYLSLVFGVVCLGYICLFLDIRRYLRSLRRALVVVSQALPQVPYWAMIERPACLRALDLKLPCTEEQVMVAYRERAKDLHPDRGGDLQQFLRLQKNFEQAMQLVQGRGGDEVDNIQ